MFCAFFVYLALTDGIDKKYPFKEYDLSSDFLLDELNDLQKEIIDEREESFIQELIDYLVSEGVEAGFKYLSPISYRIYETATALLGTEDVKSEVIKIKKYKLEELIEAKQAKEKFDETGKVDFCARDRIFKEIEWRKLNYVKATNAGGIRMDQTRSEIQTQRQKW